MNGSTVFVADSVRAVQMLHADIVYHPGFHTLTVREQLDKQAHRLVDASRSGDSAVRVQVANAFAEPVALPLTLDVAREVLAREYGFSNWASAVAEGSQMPDVVFEGAVDAVIHGDLDLLARLLIGDPTLVWARSAYGHQATLLHYVAANGVEIHRQQVPANAVKVVQRLIEAGADPAATMPVYGGLYAPLPLLVSSSHVVEAGLVAALAEMLDVSAETAVLSR